MDEIIEDTGYVAELDAEAPMKPEPELKILMS